MPITIDGSIRVMAQDAANSEAIAVSGCPIKAKDPLTTGVNGSDEVDVAGFEPATPTMSR